MNQTYDLDLDDDKILITTQIKDWVETCSDLPRRVFEGCSCIVQRKCSCSLQVERIYIPQSIQACTLPDFTDLISVPNYLAVWAYYKSHNQSFNEKEVGFMTDDDLKYFDIPKINISKHKCTKQIGHLGMEQNFRLKAVLNASKFNKPIFQNPIEACIDQQDNNLFNKRLSGLDVGLSLSYITPFLVFIQSNCLSLSETPAG